MKENTFEQKNNIPEINSVEFNPVNKYFMSKSGLEVFVVGAVFKNGNTWVLLRKDNGEMEVKRLNEIVNAADPVWKKIEKFATKTPSQPVSNIRPRGRYSYMDRLKGNI